MVKLFTKPEHAWRQQCRWLSEYQNRTQCDQSK